MFEIKGKIYQIFYKNEDNNYCIAKVKYDDEYISIKGYFDVIINNEYSFEGSWEEDDRYGEYFKVQSYQEVLPSEEEKILKYLSSEQFQGLGLRSAKKIYQSLGDQTLLLLKNNPEIIYEVDDLKDSLKDVVYNHFASTDLRNSISIALSELSLPNHILDKIYLKLKIKDDPIFELKHNPYQLITYTSENRITFNIVDEIFRFFNENLYAEVRLENLFIHEFVELTFKIGDSKTKINQFQEILLKKHNITDDFFDVTINNLLEKNIFCKEEEFIQLYSYKLVEQKIAHKMLLKKRYFANNELLSTKSIEEHLAKKDFKFAQLQIQAIKNALLEPISIVTGGPGTGKTTIVNAIIDILLDVVYKNEDLENIYQKIALISPTGRASFRLFETTNFPAKTIHSLLQLKNNTTESVFNEHNQLPYDFYIIDEFSMVDMFLFEKLINAMQEHAKIIIIGDDNQLESIGPGSVLRDLLESNQFPVTKLDKIYRQKEGSSISQLAKDILDCNYIRPFNDTEISIIHSENNLLEKVNSIFQSAINSGLDESQVQILAAKYKGEVGIDAINEKLHTNISERKIDYRMHTYYEGDKILILKNLYEKDIYNGDIGYISKIINPEAKGIEDCLEIEIRNQKKIFSYKELEMITHAYCISIHKSQGSEFDAIILPIFDTSTLTKNLIYTAITRAKQKLVIIGNISKLNKCLLKSKYIRNTNLRKFLEE